jgi:DNA-directed RNA polymerase subunit F
MSEKLRKEVGTMCNLADGIEERAEARGEARGELRSITNVVMNMHHKNYTLEEIVNITGKTIEEVKSIIERNTSVLV